MAGGLGKVGKPQLDRFQLADQVMGGDAGAPAGDPYAPSPSGEQRSEAAAPSATVKKTLNLTTRSLEDLRHIDTTLMRSGRKAKETELLRAALDYLARQPDDVIVEVYDGIEKLQTGPRRPG